MKWYIITSVIVSLIIVLIYLFCVENNEEQPPVNLPSVGFPECYIAKEDKCVIGYEQESILGLYWDNEYIQCCRAPHYLLQDISHGLINQILFKNDWIKREVFDPYGCNIKDINRKLYCTDVDDCYERPNLTGCYRDAGDCNWCCQGWCRLVACYHKDESLWVGYNRNTTPPYNIHYVNFTGFNTNLTGNLTFINLTEWYKINISISMLTLPMELCDCKEFQSGELCACYYNEEVK